MDYVLLVNLKKFCFSLFINFTFHARIIVKSIGSIFHTCSWNQVPQKELLKAQKFLPPSMNDIKVNW